MVLLQHIYPVVEQLSIVMAVPETAKLLASLMDSITKDCQPQVATGAMELVLVVVKSFLFTESAARAVLLPTVARSLRFNLAQRTDLPLCTESLGYMMNFYRAMSCCNSDSANNTWRREVEVVTVTTLDVLIQAVLLAERANSNVVNRNSIAVMFRFLINLLNVCVI